METATLGEVAEGMRGGGCTTWTIWEGTMEGEMQTSSGKGASSLTERGLEPVAWYPSTDFSVTSGGGSVYGSDDVDLTEGDWTEYCEKSAAPVSIMEIEHKFETA